MQMSQPPNDLLSAIPSGKEEVVRDWWSSLSELDQKQLVELWDNRLEVCFFSPQSDPEGQTDEWSQIPKVVGGRFVPTDNASGLSEWGPDYFEYLLLNPELVLAYEPAERTFHIGCHQHLAARACLINGTVPRTFNCPVASTSCPLEALRGSFLKGYKAK